MNDAFRYKIIHVKRILTARLLILFRIYLDFFEVRFEKGEILSCYLLLLFMRLYVCEGMCDVCGGMCDVCGGRGEKTLTREA